MDKLSSYKLDRAFTDGVEIVLDDAPDCIFMVRLPSATYNRDYARAIFEGMAMDVGSEGEVKMGKVNMVVAKQVQDDAFVDHCIKSIDNKPVPKHFLRDYPTAVAELLEKANALTAKLEEKIADSVKKSEATSNGSSDGAERSDSMPSLSSAAR